VFKKFTLKSLTRTRYVIEMTVAYKKHPHNNYDGDMKTEKQLSASGPWGHGAEF